MNEEETISEEQMMQRAIGFELAKEELIKETDNGVSSYLKGWDKGYAEAEKEILEKIESMCICANENPMYAASYEVVKDEIIKLIKTGESIFDIRTYSDGLVKGRELMKKSFERCIITYNEEGQPLWNMTQVFDILNAMFKKEKENESPNI